MSVYLLPIDSWDFGDPLFAFDAPTSESREDTWKWTEYGIEAGAEVSDFGTTAPRVYELAGIVSAWMALSEDEVFTRLSDIHEKLTSYANTRQPVTMVCETWCEDVVITKATAKRDRDTGEALDISISFKSYAVATYETVEIPPELLAPTVKASATPAPAAADPNASATGTAESTTPPPPPDGSLWTQGYDAGLIPIGVPATPPATP